MQTLQRAGFKNVEAHVCQGHGHGWWWQEDKNEEKLLQTGHLEITQAQLDRALEDFLRFVMQNYNSRFGLP